MLTLVLTLGPAVAHAAPVAPPTSNRVVTAASSRTKGPVASKAWKKAALAKTMKASKLTKKQRAKYEKEARKAWNRAKVDEAVARTSNSR